MKTVNTKVEVYHFEPFLNSHEAAKLFGINHKTLQNLARRGEVPAHKIGDLWRFRASELDAWARGKVPSDRHSRREPEKETSCSRERDTNKVV